jgi:hypothetical protein
VATITFATVFEKVESIDSFYQVRALAAQQERFAQQLN